MDRISGSLTTYLSNSKIRRSSLMLYASSVTGEHWPTPYLVESSRVGLRCTMRNPSESISLFLWSRWISFQLADKRLARIAAPSELSLCYTLAEIQTCIFIEMFRRFIEARDGFVAFNVNFPLQFWICPHGRGRARGDPHRQSFDGSWSNVPESDTPDLTWLVCLLP